MNTRTHLFDLNQTLCEQLAQWIAIDLAAAIKKRGQATLAVSGGSTPKPLFELLSYCDIDWSKVVVTLVDERWVGATHKDSNALLVSTHLLVNKARAAKFIGLKTEHVTPYEAEVAVSHTLQSFKQGIDVSVLGMGDDGHTASFFPGAKTLAKALDLQQQCLCTAVTPPTAPHERMTLSLATLQRSNNMYLHITGDNKWKVLQAALTPGSLFDLPIRSALFKSGPPVDIFYASE